MTYAEVNTMIASLNVKYAYYQFREGTAVPPPFICFFFTADNDFIADNANYHKIRSLQLELYTDQKDFQLEDTIEAVLTQNGLVYSKEESYIDTEKMMMVAWTCDIVITEGD